jgi:hypothetical protein
MPASIELTNDTLTVGIEGADHPACNAIRTFPRPPCVKARMPRGLKSA